MDTANRTILAIEPNEVEREGLAFVLRRAGYAVALVADGREALDYLGANPPPALILTAMLMPVLNGWGFLSELGHLPGLAGVPVVVVTISPAIGPEWARDHGCAGFVRKPVETELLLAEIRRCLP